LSEEDVTTAVGTTVLFEDDRVRVWDFTLEPGERSEMHRHDHDYVIVYATDAQVVVQSPGGEPQSSAVADGYVSHTRLGSGAQDHLVHRLGNDGPTRLRHFVIELLGASDDREGSVIVTSNDPDEA
jgi:beta-alanine degradation protein BauB